MNTLNVNFDCCLILVLLSSFSIISNLKRLRTFSKKLPEAALTNNLEKTFSN